MRSTLSADKLDWRICFIALVIAIAKVLHMNVVDIMDCPCRSVLILKRRLEIVGIDSDNGVTLMVNPDADECQGKDRGRPTYDGRYAEDLQA